MGREINLWEIYGKDGGGTSIQKHLEVGIPVKFLKVLFRQLLP